MPELARCATCGELGPPPTGCPHTPLSVRVLPARELAWMEFDDAAATEGTRRTVTLWGLLTEAKDGAPRTYKYVVPAPDDRHFPLAIGQGASAQEALGRALVTFQTLAGARRLVEGLRVVGTPPALDAAVQDVLERIVAEERTSPHDHARVVCDFAGVGPCLRCAVVAYARVLLGRAPWPADPREPPPRDPPPIPPGAPYPAPPRS